MNSSQMQDYNREGLFPGPSESEEAFIRRAEFCLNLRKNWESLEQRDLPFEIDDAATKEILHHTAHKTEELYGIIPTWVPLFFSNYKLAPWLGGCAWIFQLTETSPTSAFLQLRSAFKRHPIYLGIYDRNELIAHELSHVGRMMYEEPRFEEFFAYQSSPSTFRRWIGPLFQSSKESFFFVLVLAMVLIANLALHSNVWINIIPVLLILMGLVRLSIRHNQMAKAHSKLKQFIHNHHHARHLLYRLTDKEIISFSKWTTEEIKKYINSEANTSFRWRFLISNYCN